MASVSAAATAAGPQASAVLYSYAEDTCWGPDDQLRGALQPVVFRLFSVGRGLGTKLDVEFTSDYGVYFDGDDEMIIGALQQAAPAVPWAAMVYHRWLDQSKIQVINPDTGRIVAQVETRRYAGRRVTSKKVAAGHYGPNVVTLEQLRQAREVQKLLLEVLESEA